jgi:hypothetical protein
MSGPTDFEKDDHARSEARAATALRQADPVAALAELAADPTLPANLRAAYAAADEDGVRVAALLVAKLRFERLLRGSDDAGAWFERDSAGFTESFRRYHREVAPTAFWPADEGRCFETWVRRPA